MKVLKKLPGEAWQLVDVENELKSLQQQVDGYIQAVTIGEDACIICNEEGRINGMPHNCDLLENEFFGPLLVVGVAGEEFTDVPPAAIRWLADQRKAQ